MTTVEAFAETITYAIPYAQTGVAVDDSLAGTVRQPIAERHEVGAGTSSSATEVVRSVFDELPPQLFSHIRNEIESSRRILELEDDFDDEGSPGYSEQVWKRAVEFLAKNAKWLLEIYGHLIDAPAILPGSGGSIDIHWDCPSYELLINFPADPQAMAGFYGDDRGEISIEGKFDPSTFNHGLLLWLAKASR